MFVLCFAALVSFFQQPTPPLDFDWAVLKSAFESSNWLVFSAVLILIGVRVSKLPALGNQWDRIPKRYRPLIPVGLGILSGLCEAIISSKEPWGMALFKGLLSGLLAIGSDQLVTKPFVKPADLGKSTPNVTPTAEAAQTEQTDAKPEREDK